MTDQNFRCSFRGEEFTLPEGKQPRKVNGEVVCEQCYQNHKGEAAQPAPAPAAPTEAAPVDEEPNATQRSGNVGDNPGTAGQQPDAGAGSSGGSGASKAQD